jgi:hypothetical protein
MIGKHWQVGTAWTDEKPRGLGAGYNHDKWKSNNAVEAEEEGRMNATKLSKILKVPSAFILDHVPSSEWHHTSSKYNKTKYYDVDEAKEFMSGKGKKLYEKWKQKKEAEKSSYTAIVRIEEFDKRAKAMNRETFYARIKDTGGVMVEITADNKRGILTEVSKGYGGFEFDSFRKTGGFKGKKSKKGKHIEILRDGDFGYKTAAAIMKRKGKPEKPKEEAVNKANFFNATRGKSVVFTKKKAPDRKPDKVTGRSSYWFTTVGVYRESTWKAWDTSWRLDFDFEGKQLDKIKTVGYAKYKDFQ